nr:MAG TPA: hypothetical protein [Bacteriophage sp.]
MVYHGEESSYILFPNVEFGLVLLFYKERRYFLWSFMLL